MDEDEDFFFESDHLALRGNKDYKCMLRLILILESQKMMLIQDIEKLATSKKAALENPQEFLNDLKNSKIEFPSSNYSIPEVPTIAWSKYGIGDNQVLEWKKTFEESDQEKSNNILIRGRAFDQSKPETFNQLWTCEEQRRLEELLKEYPEEEVEMRRWVKIANALGNRTPKQVMSRVQKYFIKLQQAGLPVPGRVRKPCLTKVGGASFRHHRSSKVFHKRSTFFPAQDVPVLMDESTPQNESEGSVENIPPAQWTPLEMMSAVYERRKIEENSTVPLPIHSGISCIGCSCESITGTRWTDGMGSDWCSDCLIEFQPITKLTPVSAMNFQDDFNPP